MPLAVACGLGEKRLASLFNGAINPHNVVLIAARDVDPGEVTLLNQQGVNWFKMSDINTQTIQELVQTIARKLSNKKIHLSFDFDAITLESFPATGTPVTDGLTVKQGLELLKGLKHSGLEFVSNDWVEFEPRHPEAEQSADYARQLFTAFHG
jgi:arginase